METSYKDAVINNFGADIGPRGVKAGIFVYCTVQIGVVYCTNWCTVLYKLVYCTVQIMQRLRNVMLLIGMIWLRTGTGGGHL